MSVLRGIGHGAFAAPVRFPAGWYPSDIAIGDLDGDGHADLVVTADESDTVVVLRGNRD